MSHELEQEKSKQACKIMDELDLDVWLVWVRETSQMADPVLELILGADLVWQSALLYSRNGEKVAIVGNFDADGIKSTGVFDKIVPYTQSITEDFLTELDRLAPKNIGINFSTNDVTADGLSVGMHMLLKEMLKDTKHIDVLTSAEALIGKLRGRKVAGELTRIEKAVEITERIFDESQQFVRVGLTELQVYDFFHQRMREYGVSSAWYEDHNPAVDAGPNKQFGHSGPTDSKLKSGHLLHFDFGVKYEGYCSDIQRMFFLGSELEVPEEIKTAFQAVNDAITAASEFVKPGIKGHEADAVARDLVKERGYEEYQHALGHQLGRNAHDGGTLLGPLWDRYGETPNGIVEEGNVFTLELYVSTENYGQLSLEEDIIVTSTGCRFLSQRQLELVYID
ncbi:MAG: aminopeptidase P family protein [Candidatus Thorarchaeota archaeon]|nr:MAG: aminopeptidase P family protein [Candidatus Thorarchaeota archaeon]